MSSRVCVTGSSKASYVQPCLCDWVIKGLGMSSCVGRTGHMKDFVPLIEKSRASCPGGWFFLLVLFIK